MAGGTWESQNKVRPGVYIRFTSADTLGLTVGERGIVTICEPLPWGPVGQVMTITPDMDTTSLTGYPIHDPHNLFLQQIFAGSKRTAAPKGVLLYRPDISGAAQAAITVEPLTATAVYPGARGNDIRIVVDALTEPESAFQVSTVVDGDIVDQQQVATCEELVSNEWVRFSGTGAPAETAGAALTGGENGTVDSGDYADYLTAIEPYKFDIMIYDGTDSTTMQAMQQFIQRMANDNGMYAQLVMANAENPDSRFVINVMSGYTLSDGTVVTMQQACWWVGGAEAGAKYNEALTYASVPGAVSVTPMMTGRQYEAALKAGQFVLFADDGAVKVEQDINSLVTYTPDISPIYRKNRTMRLCNTIANDVYRQFSNHFIGVVNNNADGRNQFQAAIVGYLLDIQANQGIQNFTAEDVQVLPGTDSDAILVNIALQVVDSVEKIYMTIEVSKGVQA